MTDLLTGMVILGSVILLMEANTACVKVQSQVDRLLALRERVRFSHLAAPQDYCDAQEQLTPPCSLFLRKEGAWLAVCHAKTIGRERNRWWRIVCPAPQNRLLFWKTSTISVSFKS